jgi:polyhydroxybutyrate depolymerase
MRRPSLLLLSAVLIGVAGCSNGSGPSAAPTPTAPTPTGPTVAAVQPAPGDHTVTFTEPDGRERSYRAHAPATYVAGTAVPLVLVFHGSPGTPDQIRTQSGMDQVADTHGFLVVYPDHFADAASVSRLLEQVVPTWNVDRKRVYAAGFSRGASLVYDLAEQLSTTFAAVAPVSGVGASGTALPRPISLITFQGDRDQLSGAFNQTNTAWAKSAQCGPAQTQAITMEGGPAYIASSTCADGAEHVVYSVTHMGHSWPAEASALVWEFFNRHPLP